MSGFTNAFAATVLDTHLVTGDYIAFSTNGTSETANVPRSAITWAAASAGAPASKAGTGALVTATGAATITHVCVFSAVTAGTQKTDWQATTEDPDKVLAADDTYTPSITITQE